MEKHIICKICNKQFFGGRAMGGHMKSHPAMLPPLRSYSRPHSSNITNSHVSPSPPFLTSNRGMHSSLDSSIVHDGHNSESHPTNPTMSRPKRRRKVILKSLLPLEAEQVSVSNAFTAEDEMLLGASSCFLGMHGSSWRKRRLNLTIAKVRVFGLGSERRASICARLVIKSFYLIKALGGHRSGHMRILKSQVSCDSPCSG